MANFKKISLKYREGIPRYFILQNVLLVVFGEAQPFVKIEEKRSAEASWIYYNKIDPIRTDRKAERSLLLSDKHDHSLA